MHEPTHSHTHTYLSWLRREDISRFMVWLLSVSSSSSLCSFLFWALEREFSSSTSSSCLFSCFSRTIDLSSCRRRAGRRKRRERTERSREVELRQEFAGKWGPRRRSRGRYLNGEISVRTGGPMGIRSQIKPGRLLQMMLWEESQCLSVTEGFIFRGGTCSNFAMNTQMPMQD